MLQREVASDQEIGAFFRRKNKKKRQNWGKSQVTLPYRKSTWVWSQPKGNFWEVYLPFMDSTTVFMSEETSGNCWLGRSRVALASVCRCCQIEINMRKHRTARYEEGMRPFTPRDHPSPWFGKLVLRDSARPGCRGGWCPSCLSNHCSWSWLVAACWDTYFHLLGIG